MKRHIPWHFWLALICILVLAGCSTTMSKITTTTVIPGKDGQPAQTITQTKEIDGEVAYYLAKIDQAQWRKPIMEMEADASGIIEIKARKIVVWGYPQHGQVKPYVHPWAGVVSSGITGFSNLGLTAIGLWGVNNIVNSVGEHVGSRTITNYDRSFNASGTGAGVVQGSGAITPTVTQHSHNPTTTSTDSHDTTSP